MQEPTPVIKIIFLVLPQRLLEQIWMWHNNLGYWSRNCLFFSSYSDYLEKNERVYRHLHIRVLTAVFSTNTLTHSSKKSECQATWYFSSITAHHRSHRGLCWGVSFRTLPYSKNTKWRAITETPKGFPMPCNPKYILVFSSKHWFRYHNAWLAPVLVLEDGGCREREVQF